MSIEVPLMSQQKFCPFLNWNLSSFSLLFLSPLVSFIYFDFYLTSPFWITLPHFLLSVKGVQWSVFKCADTWGVTSSLHQSRSSWSFQISVETCRIIVVDSSRPIVSAVPVNSERIWMWFQLYWKAYLLTFPCISRTSKMESVCGLGVHFRPASSCSPNQPQE